MDNDLLVSFEGRTLYDGDACIFMDVSGYVFNVLTDNDYPGVWEHRLAKREYLSLRNRAKRGLRRLRTAFPRRPRDLRYRVSLAYEALRGRHSCEDYCEEYYW